MQTAVRTDERAQAIAARQHVVDQLIELEQDREAATQARRASREEAEERIAKLEAELAATRARCVEIEKQEKAAATDHVRRRTELRKELYTPIERAIHEVGRDLQKAAILGLFAKVRLHSLFALVNEIRAAAEDPTLEPLLELHKLQREIAEAAGPEGLPA